VAHALLNTYSQATSSEQQTAFENVPSMPGNRHATTALFSGLPGSLQSAYPYADSRLTNKAKTMDPHMLMQPNRLWRFGKQPKQITNAVRPRKPHTALIPTPSVQQQGKHS